MKYFLSTVVSLALLSAFLSGCMVQSVEQTNDSLTVYFTKKGERENDSSAPIDKYAESVIARFNQDYPDINVTLYNPAEGSSEMTEAQIEQIFNNDMMAGKGPDVIIADSSITTYKMMKGGAFLDLLPIMNADQDFDKQNYQQVMLDAGKLDGKQYFMPVSCTLPYLLTTKTTLDASGFDISSCDNPQKYVQQAVDMMSKEHGMRIDSATSYDRMIYSGWAADLVDYASANLRLDTPDFRSFQELQKTVYQYDHIQNQRPVEKSAIAPTVQQEALFYPLGGYIIQITAAAQPYTHYSSPIAVLSKNSSGDVVGTVKKIAAIRANSTNQQLAYDFIKVLVDHYYKPNRFVDIPISYSARKESLDANETYATNFPDDTYSLIDRNGEVIETWIAEPYQEKIKPFVEETYFLAEELDQVTLTSDVLLKASEYFEPYYQDKDSYENCLKTAQGQLAIYLSE